MKVFIALLKREILEHKSIWRVPLILVGIAVLVRISLIAGNLALDVNLPSEFQVEGAEAKLDSALSSVMSSVIAKAIVPVNMIVTLVMFLVAVFYALSSLYNERQDDSVLFWRSLPISDGLTVASKLCIALVVVPLIMVLVQAFVVVLFLGGDSGSYLSTYFTKSLTANLFILLWSLMPVVAWCVFCSGIANKTPFLLAIIAPVLLIFVDKLFLNGLISQQFIINRVTGVDEYSISTLVYGLVFSGICIFLAILKRSQRV